jgi:hypothetical protein
MKIRTSIIAAGAAVALGTTGALVLPAIASANSTTHTLKFISVSKARATFAKGEFGGQDTDTNAAGKTIGFDDTYIAATSASSGTLNATVDTTGGMLYATGTINLNSGALSNGKVTGGTGAFAGATGTLKAKTINSKKTAITITYSG